MEVVQHRERDYYGAGVATISEEESQRVRRKDWKGCGGENSEGAAQGLEGVRRNVCSGYSRGCATGAVQRLHSFPRKGYNYSSEIDITIPPKALSTTLRNECGQCGGENAEGSAQGLRRLHRKNCNGCGVGIGSGAAQGARRVRRNVCNHFPESLIPYPPQRVRAVRRCGCNHSPENLIPHPPQQVRAVRRCGCTHFPERDTTIPPK